MITEHPDIETLSALADRELTGASLLRAEKHVAECVACRDTLDRVRALVRAAGALPPDAAPPPEVWAGIRRGIRPRPRRRTWALASIASIAAAAVLVLAVGTQLTRPGRSGKVRAPDTVVIPAIPASLVSVDRSYAAPIAELRLTLEQQRHTLSPATVRIVERSIAVIDTAIAEARAALAADPANEFIADILSAQYKQKLDLLQRATKLSPST